MTLPAPVDQTQVPHWGAHPAVLLVAHEGHPAARWDEALRDAGYAVTAVASREAAMEALDRVTVDVVITELRTARIQGLGIIAVARRRNPDVGAVLLIEPDQEERAVKALSRTVIDYQSAPFRLPKLLAIIARIEERQALCGKVARLTQQLDRRFSFPNLIGQSTAAARMRSWLKEVSPTDLHVLLIGEEGSGKRLIAGMLHHNSPRRNEALVELDCAALPPRQLQRELFGPPVRARNPRRPGRLEKAAQGTLLLRGATSLPIELQARVAEVLRTGVLRPVFGAGAIEIHPRLVLAAEEDPRGLVEDGRFDPSLLDLVGESVHDLLPLRHRRRDILDLADHFLAEESKHLDTPLRLHRATRDALLSYDWPGNTRELRQVIRETARTKPGGGEVAAEDLPEDIREHGGGERRRLPVGTPLAEIERRMIQETLRLCEGNREKAAAILGIGVRTLYRKIKSFR